ncbi:MAG: chromosomal replication initiator protein DnaA [Candidatus Omnitrophica bacterium]|nr:chromosomal replication initiator protein DnaA [Candidatus Omnitrophota bacterium]
MENEWKQTLERVEKRLNNARAYDIWIKPVKFKERNGNTVKIEIPGMTFEKGFLPFLAVIKEEFEKIYGWQPDIELFYSGEVADKAAAIFNESPLNPGYTFDNFVVGSNNQLAHAAAQAVSQSPGIAYNPLFLYGGFGLGKTHLMQAIVQSVKEREETKIIYIPAEVYLNDFIQSIKNKTTNLFRQKFRKLDFLLIDDIHFIAGKEGTQEEFFHMFNFLYDQRKQIILSSDRPPAEISFLEKRLISRFEWGLVAEILPPDFETRVAILKKKCEIKNINVNDDIIFYIAENIKDNVRILEGVLNRIFAFSSLLNKEIDKTIIDEIMDGEYYKKRVIINLETIMAFVCEYFKIKEEDLLSKTRMKNILMPRQIAMFLSRELTNNSLHSIAVKFGGKDHTTILYACKKIKKLYDTDEYIKGVVDEIRKSIEK